MSAHPMEVRLAHLEGAYEQISHRLNGIDGRLDGIGSRLDSMDHRFDALSEKIDQRALWLMGLVLVSIMLPVVLKFAGH